MVDTLKVTVLMTVYNGGKHLSKSMESVLNQTYENFEFLIINDYSTDNSIETIKSFKDDRIVCFENKENIGQTKSLNVGLRMAKGQYVARMDADDLAFPDWLHEQVAFFNEHKGYAAVSTRAVAFDNDNKIIKVLNTPVTYEEILLKVLISSPINHVGALMDKNIILSVGGYDEKFQIAADYDLWSKFLLNKFKIVTNKSIGVAIRHHKQSISRAKHNTTGLSELSQIIYKNIQNFTDQSFSLSEADLLRDLIYSVRVLNSEECKRALLILKKSCFLFKKEFTISENMINDVFRRSSKILKLKNLFRVFDSSVVLKIIPLIYSQIRLIKAKASLEGHDAEILNLT